MRGRKDIKSEFSAGIFQAGMLEWIARPWDLPNPGIQPRSPALQADSLPSEPPGKPSLEWTLILKHHSLCVQNSKVTGCPGLYPPLNSV